jgi:hypothetical protein
MNITLQGRCQPGINCLRTLSCRVRMKTTYRSNYCSTQGVIKRCIFFPVEKRLAASPAAHEETWRVAALARTAKAGVCEQQMLGANHRLIFGENQGAFDHVLQFANVAGPGLRLQ